MTKSKIIVLAVVLALVILGGWYFGNKPTTAPSDKSNTSAPAVTAENSTDASLDKDLQGIDVQMNGLSSDSASIDQGLNDKPIEQNP